MNVAVRPTNGLTVPWYQDPKMVALVKRTAAKDCNVDEFDEFTAVCRELGLNPLRKQIYAFVFSKDKPAERNMAIVVGIDGGRSIAARTGNYRPDNQPPVWVTSEEAKDPDTNPEGIVSATVGAFHRPTKNDPFERIVATVFWREFVPIVRTADPDAYEWIDTGETWPDSGKPKKVKRLRVGAQADVKERLDPKKKQWTNMGRHKLALCAEMQVLRRGWPENLARVYVDEETDKASAVLDLGERRIRGPDAVRNGGSRRNRCPHGAHRRPGHHGDVRRCRDDRAGALRAVRRSGACRCNREVAGRTRRAVHGAQSRSAQGILGAQQDRCAEAEKGAGRAQRNHHQNRLCASRIPLHLTAVQGVRIQARRAGRQAPGALPVGTGGLHPQNQAAHLRSLAQRHHPTSSAGPRARRCT
jgi:phage recombination protein Bet